MGYMSVKSIDFFFFLLLLLLLLVHSQCLPRIFQLLFVLLFLCPKKCSSIYEIVANFRFVYRFWGKSVCIWLLYTYMNWLFERNFVCFFAFSFIENNFPLFVAVFECWNNCFMSSVIVLVTLYKTQCHRLCTE